MIFTKISQESELKNFTSFTENFSELSVDIEGDNLSRHGKIFTIQVYAPSTDTFYLFDCRNLSYDQVRLALSSVFRSFNIKKYFFDCRSDIDALYHQYNIEINNVIDVQLFEVGFRKCSGFGRTKYYFGLYKTLTEYKNEIGITNSELIIKNKISDQFKSKNYDIDINDDEILRYLAIDVVYLKKLYDLFYKKIGHGKIFKSILEETEKRRLIWQNKTFINDRSNAISAI